MNNDDNKDSVNYLTKESPEFKLLVANLEIKQLNYKLSENKLYIDKLESKIESLNRIIHDNMGIIEDIK